MVIASPELSLITVGMKAGTKGLHSLVGTNFSIICQRTSSVPGLFFPPVSATPRSRFRTCALIQRNKSSPRKRDSDVGLTGAVCTIGSHYPTRGSWGCKVKPATHNMEVSTILTSLLFVTIILWDMTRRKKLKRLFALFLLSLCICIAIWAAKGDETAIFIITLFDKAGKIYNVLGHLLTIFGGLP